MNPIGIMQGRLSPPAPTRIQSFPIATWRDEFAWAREAGLDCIEWIYETETDGVNPIGSDSGVAEIRGVAEASGVAVWSLCADYYMKKPLVALDGAPNRGSVQHLCWLLGRAARLDLCYIVLPFVDASSLRMPQGMKGLVEALQSVIPAAEGARVELHLETDFLARDLVAVLEAVRHPRVRANYDIGNSASLGHDPADELPQLGPWLGSVHIKDRLRGGATVPLGTGGADFRTCFRLILAAGFSGPFILQAARDPGQSEVQLAKRNRAFVEEQIAMAESAS